MFRKKGYKIFKIWGRSYAKDRRNRGITRELCFREEERNKVDKVAICGAGTSFGRTLAMLLKLGDCVKMLTLFDNENVCHVASDLESIDTKCKVKSFSGRQTLRTALENADVVVILDGWDGFLFSDEDDCLHAAAPLVHDYGLNIANACPEALVCLFSHPIDSTLPLISETLKRCKAYDPRKILGPCALSETRAKAAAGNYLGLDPASVSVPVIGGTSIQTCVPLFSKAEPYHDFSEQEIHDLTVSVADAWDECRKLHTAAPLSSAHGAAGFVSDLCAALCGFQGIYRTAFVRSAALPQTTYFASLLRIGRQGIELDCGVPKINDYELEMLENALPALERSAEKGVSAFRRLIREEIRREVEKCAGKPCLNKTPVPDCEPVVPSEVCLDCVPENPCARVP